MNLKPETITEIESLIPKYPQKRSAMLPILHAVQKDQGYISKEAMEWVAEKTETRPIDVYGVVSFYPFFREHPIGKHYIRLCRTLSCALSGSYNLLEAIKREFGCDLNKTSDDGLFTLEFAECLASCGSGPVMMIDDDLYERLTEEKIKQIAADYRARAAQSKA
ncbi:MAG: NAD(P)H-dependent oxidoreductase subunit E [Opitutales bacterium]|nr:NAD(P)H-dependent oxidoreductase subunit E [Opitutales bacterium]